MAKRVSRRRPIPARPPRGFSAAYVRLFGTIDPHVALKVDEYVQREAIDRTRKWSVDGAVALIAAELGVCKARGYKFLRAGRYLRSKGRR